MNNAALSDRSEPKASAPGASGQPTTSSAPAPVAEDAATTSFCARFERRVQETPTIEAVHTDRGALTCDALNRAANRLAHAILARRGQADKPVAFLLEYGAPQITAIIGILKAGGFYAALDAALYPPARLAWFAEYLQTDLIVTDNAHLTLAQALSDGKIPLLNLDALEADLSEENPGIYPPLGGPAMILFTSGSTGRPKGVVHSQRMLSFCAQMVPGLSYTGVRLLQHSSCSYVASIVLFQSLVNGGTLYPYDLKKRGLENLPQWMIEHEISRCFFVTSMFRHLVGLLKGATFSKLEMLTLGGEAVTAKEVEQWRQCTGPNCRLLVGFGSTEGGGTMQVLTKDGPPSESAPSIGQPSRGSEILLLNETGEEVAPGETGEIVARSPLLALGYWRDPELTNQKFRPDPKRPGENLYFTGDLGRRRADGGFEHHGRKDFQEKIRGHRINPGEIESALLETTGVTEAAVVGRNNPAGERQLVAYVVQAEGTALTAQTLLHALRPKLPAHMMPSAFVFVDALPLTATGKIDRLALPSSDGGRPDLANPYVAPATALQRSLAALWEEHLGVRPIGVHDDFFDLGGDSLLAVKMIAAVDDRLGLKMTGADLLTGLTVELLAETLSRQVEESVGRRLVEIQSGDGSLPRLFFVHGDYRDGGLYCPGLARRLGPEQGFYALPPHGLSEPFLVPRTLQEMAAANVQALLAFQPEGPYTLGGHSNGAVIAFEMAQQLRRQGRTVANVLMVAPPPIMRSRPGPGHAWLQTLWPAAAKGRPPHDLSQSSHDERRVRLETIYGEACINYRAEPGVDRVAVIQAEDDPLVDSLRTAYRHPLSSGWRAGRNRWDWARIGVERLLGAAVLPTDWQSLAREVTVEATPGDHFSILSTHLEALADRLKNHLPAPGGR